MKENAIEYIDKLHQEIDFAKLGILSKNVAIDAIINNRKSRASELGIKFIEELIIPPKLKIEDMDICIVLGNSLNNAIEACQRITDCDNNRIIKIKIKYKSEYLLIEVRNTYDINSIRMKNGKFVSSKTNRIHDEIGIGVSNIKSVVEKYDGLFQIEMGEEFFALKIMIPDKDII
jgi:sensor histidine kinase regulating citrate/malate metabolism